MKEQYGHETAREATSLVPRPPPQLMSHVVYIQCKNRKQHRFEAGFTAVVRPSK